MKSINTNSDCGAKEVKYIHNKAEKTRSSYFANWEIVSTLPRSRGKDVPLNIVPYKSRLD